MPQAIAASLETLVFCPGHFVTVVGNELAGVNQSSGESHLDDSEEELVG